MPLANEGKRKELTREERRERRLLRREKQRKDNIGRAAKMHAARLKMESENHKECEEALKASAYVGCSGWFYWKWRGMYYPEDLPTSKWFDHYAKRLDTVEINASFYSWPTVAGVKAWRRQAGNRKFVYTVKVCELITHQKSPRHKNSHKRFRYDRRYSGRPDGLLSLPASTESSLHKGSPSRDS
jgi:hypothetical protein